MNIYFSDCLTHKRISKGRSSIGAPHPPLPVFDFFCFAFVNFVCLNTMQTIN